MCYPTTCNSCGKTTWAGCGNHIDSVKAQVPANQWCTCNKTADTTSGTTNIISVLSGLFQR